MITSNFEKMIEDSSHWHNTLPPYCPNENEISIYKELIGNRSPVYLLGMTRQLIDLCDVAVDLNPITINKPTIKCDWRELEGFKAEAIVGDGVLNLVGVDFYKKALELSDIFICRVFMKKFPEMKYATIFPSEFPNSKKIIKTQKDIVIVVWEN